LIKEEGIFVRFGVTIRGLEEGLEAIWSGEGGCIERLSISCCTILGSSHGTVRSRFHLQPYPSPSLLYPECKIPDMNTLRALREYQYSHPEEQENGLCFITNHADIPVSQTSIYLYPFPIFIFTFSLMFLFLRAAYSYNTPLTALCLLLALYYICHFLFYCRRSCYRNWFSAAYSY